MKIILLSIAVFIVFPHIAYAGKFQPYEIRPDFSYYSDEYSIRDGISELGEEKNYEEVYQFYNYYEAVFDDKGHIVTFRAYKQGVVEFSEAYFYADDGRLIRKVTKYRDGSESVMDFQFMQWSAKLSIS